VYTIAKEFGFEAAHSLTGLPPEHPCSRPHGHSYRVKVLLKSEETIAPGFVLDYRALDELKEMLDEQFDHRDLNIVLTGPTTAENIAKFLFDWCKERWPEVSAVSVSETQKTWATYRE